MISPALLVRVEVSVMPGLAAAFVPFAEKAIAVKPVVALVLVMGAEMLMKELANKVSLVAAVQALEAPMALLTVMEPLFGPEPDEPTVEMVTLQLCSWVFRSVFKI